MYKCGEGALDQIETFIPAKKKIGTWYWREEEDASAEQPKS